VQAMHEAMSPENLYLRFFSLSRNSAEREAQRVCRPAGPDHAVLLAWLVGVASYEPVGTAGSAEVAFAVPDDMHGRGAATLLLEHLVSLARTRGPAGRAGPTWPACGTCCSRGQSRWSAPAAGRARSAGWSCTTS
jgi:hypothetical protein